MANKDKDFADYQASTERIADQLNQLRQQVVEWVEGHRSVPPSIVDVAFLEGLHARRAELIAELLLVEQRFMTTLLAAFKSK